MTTLADRLAQIILETGPMTIADYMRHCLLDPVNGYYSTHDPFGAGGDFVTAPEISQMFGELVGLALAQAWIEQGSPARFQLVELGPGRGTLMADALRATARVPDFHAAAQLHFVEASPKLRDIQISAISRALTHHDSVESLPDGPMFLIANEFFDALPIRQFVRDAAGWRERVVGLSDGELTFGLSDMIQRPDLNHRLGDTRNGDLVEVSPHSATVCHEIASRLSHHGGAAYLIDYGDWRSLGDTLQAVRQHQGVSPLDTPGSADLTAHVDFEALALAASQVRASRVTPQGVFLERLGITDRARALAANLIGPALDEHIAAHRRLTHPDEMGTLFKVMALYPKDATLPPGMTV